MADNSTLITLDPKERFRRSLKDPNEFHAIASTAVVQQAAQDVISHMAIRGCSREQLDGAITFAKLFLNFSEPEPVQKPFPVKKLQVQ